MNLFDALQLYPLATALRGCGMTMPEYRARRVSEPDFARQCDVAMAAREVALLDGIKLATTEDWKAGAWLLERTAGADFREVKEVQQRVQVEMERLLDALEPRMTAGAFAELLNALHELSGGAVPAARLTPGS